MATKKKKKSVLPTDTSIVNIVTEEKEENVVVSSPSTYYDIAFYSTESDFYSASDYNRFIKGCEKIVRTSDEYKAYIAFLVNEMKLDHCMILSNITFDDNVTVEMHHGPILTLFDYCAIVTEHFIRNEIPLSTFAVAKTVLMEHYDHNVQVVMLSKTAHEMAHTKKIFIHPKQAWGDLNRFLEKYHDGVTPEMADNINNYITLAEEFETTEIDKVFDVNDITDWNIKKAEPLELSEDDE